MDDCEKARVSLAELLLAIFDVRSSVVVCPPIKMEGIKYPVFPNVGEVSIPMPSLASLESAAIVPPAVVLSHEESISSANAHAAGHFVTVTPVDLRVTTAPSSSVSDDSATSNLWDPRARLRPLDGRRSGYSSPFRTSSSDDVLFPRRSMLRQLERSVSSSAATSSASQASLVTAAIETMEMECGLPGVPVSASRDSEEDLRPPGTEVPPGVETRGVPPVPGFRSFAASSAGSSFAGLNPVPPVPTTCSSQFSHIVLPQLMSALIARPMSVPELMTTTPQAFLPQDPIPPEQWESRQFVGSSLPPPEVTTPSAGYAGPTSEDSDSENGKSDHVFQCPS
jgi:hypothetical protein